MRQYTTVIFYKSFIHYSFIRLTFSEGKIGFIINESLWLGKVDVEVERMREGETCVWEALASGLASRLACLMISLRIGQVLRDVTPRSSTCTIV